MDGKRVMGFGKRAVLGVVCKSWERFTLVIGLQASKCLGCGCGEGSLLSYYP